MSTALRRRYGRARFVDQTVFGKYGNCLSAAIASVLGLPLSQVPSSFDSDQLEGIDEWAKGHGYRMRYNERSAPRGLHVLLGKSPRGGGHAVVARGGRMVHDPHPSRRGLLGVDGYIEFIPV